MKKIFLNTAASETTLHLLDNATILDMKAWPSKHNQTEDLLKEVDLLLKKNNLIPSDIGVIYVYQGPGSYTGLRVGITTANLFAFCLNIPVIGFAEGEQIEEVAKQAQPVGFQGAIMPFYGREPFITKEKARL